MNIINGVIADRAEAREFLDRLGGVVDRTLHGSLLDPQTVIDAADMLSSELNVPETLDLLVSLGMGKERAASMMAEARLFLSRAYLEAKLKRELGENPFAFRWAGEHVLEKYRPLGILTHIAAGNAAGLPAFSVLEGLLAGNINILKLPGNDDGLSTSLLKRLMEIEPRLEEYIYVFDIPSTDVDSIKKMLQVSDAVAVWGSDFAISGIRSIAPPNIQIIEWGHRLSFTWITKAGETTEALEGTARDICETEQLLCSSPQCIYYETDSFDELTTFAQRFSIVIDRIGKQYPVQPLEPDNQAEITALLALTYVEELLENKKVIRGGDWSVIADLNPVLKPSPMFRNVWVKPMRKDTLFDILRPQKGYLQTAGLACVPDEFDVISDGFFSCGVCRVMLCGSMSSNYAGEPHDGSSALRRYTRTVLVNLSPFSL